MSEKPVGEGFGWHFKEKTYPYITPWLRVRRDTLDVAGVGETTYSYLEGAGAVMIVPVMADGTILLVEEYRYPVDAVVLGLPAGGLGDKPDLAMREVARHELEEEAGATSDDLHFITSFYAVPGWTNEKHHVFLALNVRYIDGQHLEALEQITVRPTPAREALRLARSGGVEAGLSALALLVCEETLRTLGYL